MSHCTNWYRSEEIYPHIRFLYVCNNDGNNDDDNGDDDNDDDDNDDDDNELLMTRL